VRLATADDIEALDWLQDLARAGLVDVRGGALRLRECEPIRDWRSAIDGPDIVVLVGILLDIVLSYMVMVLRPDIDRGVITHAFVEEGARELGLGDTMVEHAIVAVRAAQLGGIEAVALPGDRDTKNLYERAGLTARKITVYKALLSLDG
jgi:ribosomal protein S18 acetylase RimI-like enzyme